MFRFAAFYKFLQRKCYDVLSLQYSFVLIVFSGFLFIMSLIHFGETWVVWSKKKYEAIFNSYSDNLIGKSFHDRLCQKVPIDVVYTWVNGSDPVFLNDLHFVIQDKQDVSVLNKTFASRFEDMEELRYSLRSLEMYAPWVHHVFLITNGQIPYWLDLDHPKLTVVTHKEIFVNHSHLPTFSSPAIESHLHRIPGLSKYFLYLNDDIILGKTIWPEDFLTESEGYKIFITWNLPDCSSSCTWSWVGDGSCDPPCNIEQCSYDGGDCVSNNSYPKYEYHQMNGPLYDAYVDKDDKEIEDEVKFVEDYYKSLKRTPKNKEELEEDNEVSVNVNRKLLEKDVVVYENNHIKKIKSNYLFKKYESIKPINIKKEILDVIRSNASVNVSEIVKLSNLKYINNNKALKKMKRTLKNKERNRGLQTKNSLGVKSYAMGSRYRLMHKMNTSLPQGNFTSRTTVKAENTITKTAENQKTATEKEVKTSESNYVLDMFAESLLYVNRLYNKAFGVRQRKVLAHMPHFINKDILMELQDRFAVEWKETSSHKVRSANDMQFAFSYFYFVVSEKVEKTIGEIFDDFDTDRSGTWSDREIRTLLTRVYGVPLSYPVVMEFEDFVANCSKYFKTEVEVSTQFYERYSDSKLPTVTKVLIENCPEVTEMLKQQFGTVPKYKHKFVSEKEQDSVFKMMTSNLSRVVESLDIIRSRPRKFICLNNNMDGNHNRKENEIVKAVIQDFYLSLYPKRSTFELNNQYRNRFLHMEELKRWKEERDIFYITILIIFLFIGLSALCVAFQEEVLWCLQRVIGFCKSRSSIRIFSSYSNRGGLAPI